MILISIKELFRTAKFQEILSQLSEKEAQDDFSSLSDDERILHSYYKSRSLEGLGQNEEALQIAIEAQETFSSPSDRSYLIALFVAHLYALYRLNRFDEMRTILSEGDKVIGTLSENEKKNGLPWIFLFENLRGNIFYTKGEYDAALEAYQRCLAKQEEVDSLLEISQIEANTGFVYIFKGELDAAFDHLRQALVGFESIGNSYYIGLTELMLGLLYFSKGELTAASDYLQRALDIFETIGTDQFIFLAVGYQTLVFLGQEDLQKAKNCLVRLHQFQASNPNPLQEHICNFLDALILMQSSRIKDKAKAQGLLEEIIKDENTLYFLLEAAMIHLSDLLLFEVKSSGDPAAWEEAKNLIQQLYNKAQMQKVFPTIIDALLLQAKFSIIEGDFQGAMNYFEQTKITAAEKNLGFLAQKVNTEQKRFDAEFNKWQDLIQYNASIQERINYSQIEDYFQDVKKTIKLMGMPGRQ